uniref:Uncharacterized protein n=1 Tax=Myotis myotis TaxID=51298 RepID=A0A7J7TIL1_MYOMY|nr:hypothetical protein mMyoMyo1_009016 [Myotis myotis]
METGLFLKLLCKCELIAKKESEKCLQSSVKWVRGALAPGEASRAGTPPPHLPLSPTAQGGGGGVTALPWGCAGAGQTQEEGLELPDCLAPELPPCASSQRQAWGGVAPLFGFGAQVVRGPLGGVPGLFCSPAPPGSPQLPGKKTESGRGSCPSGPWGGEGSTWPRTRLAGNVGS